MSISTITLNLDTRSFKACSTLTQLLKKHGFETSDNFADIPTAFIGRL